MTTQVGYGPLERIDGPLPLAPLYGLLPAAEAPAAGVRIVVDIDGAPFDINNLSSTDETMPEAIARLQREGILPAGAGQQRWLNGAEVYPYPPDTGSTFDTCSPGTATSGSKDFGTDVAHPQFSAFTAYLTESCKSFKVWNQQEFIARATAAFAAVESSILGRVLMRGEGVPLNPHLADGNLTVLNSGASTNAINGLALLSNAIAANTGRLGLIHCSPGYADVLRQYFALDNRTGVIRTINGLPVIPDFGYARGSTPVGHSAPSATQEWIYATGPVDIRRSEVFVMPETVEEALDRGTPGSATNGRPNLFTYRVERHYLITWDTELQTGVLIDRCQSGC